MVKKEKWKRRILQIVAILLAVFFVVISVFIYRFSKPKTDESIVKEFEEEIYKPVISRVQYKDHSVRVFSMQKELNTTLPVLIFVHGSPGSGMDFKRYLTDTELNNNANLIAYDRVGYGVDTNEEVLNDLEKEQEVLDQVIPVKNMDMVILVGYSYGGTIVAAAQKKYRSKILLAPAIKGDLEPMFWLLNLYKWKSTRNLIPNVFKNAAQEKINHLTELPSYEEKWNTSPSQIISIHGEKDRIVPFANSLFLQSKFDKDHFELITIPDGNHGLLWNQFDWIKSEILKEIEK